ncbi:MAG TPA: hypothetical protein VHM26_07965 [Chitinophagaceae bacterium]|jgi:hypothetical protein|nr:hypothetical protein [Chitinophagaceae bacterium]
MENKPDELFSIRLNKTGIASIRLLARMINVVLIFAIISWAAVMFDQLYAHIKYYNDPYMVYVYDEWLIFQWKYSHWIVYAYLFAWLLTWIFTWKFVRGIARGLNEMDEQLFNQSFRKLIIALVWGLAEMVLNMIVCFVLIRNTLYTD